MKGLLIKDFKLLKVQKNFFLLILCIAIGIEIFTNSTSSSFIIGFLSFVATLFTLSSISYDEFDNGNAFLFSLPITRKSYVIEKYGFGMILGSSFWAFGTLIVIFKEVITHKYVSIDTVIGKLKRHVRNKNKVMRIIAAFIILPIVFAVLAVMLPFQLKFGGEKGRIAIICTLVIVFLIGIVITKVANAFNINLSFLFHEIATLNSIILILVIIGITFFMLFVSYRTSLSIMKKKEF